VQILLHAISYALGSLPKYEPIAMSVLRGNSAALLLAYAISHSRLL
jgi:hypothetical protein